VGTSDSRMVIGIQPTCWTNDDFPEIGNDTPYQVILDQTKQEEYEGGSTGHNYPTHLPSLLNAVESRGLRIASTWFGTTFTSGVNFDAALTAFKQQLEFLKAVNAKDVVVAELASAVNQVRSKSVLTDRPILNTPEWYLLTTSLDVAGKIARDNGMQLSYHPHVGTCVMTVHETDQLLASTDPNYVALCLDTAHLRYGGASQTDLENLTKTHLKRIKHVHLKNVRKDVLPIASRDKYSFYQAIQEGIFTVPGDPDGDLNLDPILEKLQSIYYDRWLVIEAEQNPLNANPLECARTARKYIMDRLRY
jgi:inosose dehydratase